MANENPWAIYDTKPGWEIANGDITDAMNAARSKVRKGMDESEVYNLWKRIVAPVLDKHADYGTGDGETEIATLADLTDAAVVMHSVVVWR